MNVPVHDVLGYPVFSGSAGACADLIVDWVNNGNGPRWLACFNPHSYVVAMGQPVFASALREADWLVPDGAGVIVAARILGVPIPERVTGSDVFAAVNARLSERGGSKVALLGATDETLAALRQRLGKDYPGLTVVGAWAPPFVAEFDETEVSRMVNAINDAKPDVLWVGLGAPKQELLVHRVLQRVNVRAIGCVGAVFDFYTGHVRRSPLVFQRLGLEWLPRLVQEPRRLWRRMFVSAPLFLRDAIRRRILARSDRVLPEGRAREDDR